MDFATPCDIVTQSVGEDNSLTHHSLIDIVLVIRKWHRWRLHGNRHHFPQVPGRDSQGDSAAARPVAGAEIQAIVYGDRIELIPVRPAVELRGFLQGIDTRVGREADRV